MHTAYVCVPGRGDVKFASKQAGSACVLWVCRGERVYARHICDSPSQPSRARRCLYGCHLLYSLRLQAAPSSPHYPRSRPSSRRSGSVSATQAASSGGPSTLIAGISGPTHRRCRLQRQVGVPMAGSRNAVPRRRQLQRDARTCPGGGSARIWRRGCSAFVHMVRPPATNKSAHKTNPGFVYWGCSGQADCSVPLFRVQRRFPKTACPLRS